MGSHHGPPAEQPPATQPPAEDPHHVPAEQPPGAAMLVEHFFALRVERDALADQHALVSALMVDIAESLAQFGIHIGDAPMRAVLRTPPPASPSATDDADSPVDDGSDAPLPAGEATWRPPDQRPISTIVTTNPVVDDIRKAAAVDDTDDDSSRLTRRVGAMFENVTASLRTPR